MDGLDGMGMDGWMMDGWDDGEWMDGGGGNLNMGGDGLMDG